MKRISMWKAVIAVVVALAFVLPGSAAFANVGTIKVTSSSKNTVDINNNIGGTIMSDTPRENTILTEKTGDPPMPLAGTTRYVGGSGPGNYTTISAAITAAVAGDTIYVYNGTYNEKVTVSKRLDLVGESRENVIVDGSGSGNVIAISSSASQVTITAFTIKNGSYGVYSSSSNNKVTNCTIYGHSTSGIYNYGAGSLGCAYKDCDVHNNGIGVYFYNSPSNVLVNCEVYDNSNYGIYLRGSRYTNLTDTAINNGIFYVSSSVLLDFYQYIDTSNTLNGKTIYYLVGQSNRILDETDNIGYLGLISCTNITARNSDVNGVLVVDTINSTISNISSHHGRDGIYLWLSSNTEIINCTSYNNNQYGLYFSASLDSNLKDNAIYNNLYDFWVAGTDISHFYHTIDASNTVNGKPIYYLIEEGLGFETIDGREFDGTAMGFLGLISCKGMTAKNLDLQGILMVNTSNSTISNIYTHNTYAGLYSYLSSNNEFTNCHFYKNYIGCYMWTSSKNNFRDCESYGNSNVGYYFKAAVNNNNFTNCDSHGNLGQSITFTSSNNNTFMNCDFYRDSRGPYISNAMGNNFINCNFHDMAYPLYITSGSHRTNLTNCNVYNGTGRGISYSGANGNSIVNCTAYNIAGDGSYLFMKNSIMSGCTFHHNTGNGIYLFVAENNKIENCVSFNNSGGIYLYSAKNHIIVNCSSFNNKYGISSSSSTGNVIHHNNFFGNVNASDSGTNQWDDNISEGNYWGNYTGIDADGDGIGDTPYNISGGSNQDRYPLMEPIISTPELLSPADGSSTPDQTPTFDWSDVVSTNYTLQVATDPGFVALVINQAGISTSEYTPAMNLPCDTYFWRVRAVCGVAGDWSEVWTVQIIPNDAPNTPQRPTGPNEGITGIECSFSTSTTDPNDNQVYYMFSWDDGTESIWLGPYDSGNTTEASHTWTEEGYYAVKVKAKDIYDAESDWSDTSMVHITISVPPVPDLDCAGGLTWTDVEPGSTVAGEFTVKNIGDPTSLLDWEITEWPSWGTWTFTPSSGNDLTPEDGAITVIVSVVAPDEENKEFSGEVKIVNTEDSSDFEIISISLITPVSQNSANAISAIMSRTDHQIHLPQCLIDYRSL